MRRLLPVNLVVTEAARSDSGVQVCQPQSMPESGLERGGPARSACWFPCRTISSAHLITRCQLDMLPLSSAVAQVTTPSRPLEDRRSSGAGQRHFGLNRSQRARLRAALKSVSPRRLGRCHAVPPSPSTHPWILPPDMRVLSSPVHTRRLPATYHAQALGKLGLAVHPSSNSHVPSRRF